MDYFSTLDIFKASKCCLSSCKELNIELLPIENSPKAKNTKKNNSLYVQDVVFQSKHLPIIFTVMIMSEPNKIDNTQQIISSLQNAITLDITNEEGKEETYNIRLNYTEFRTNSILDGKVQYVSECTLNMQKAY